VCVLVYDSLILCECAKEMLCLQTCTLNLDFKVSFVLCYWGIGKSSASATYPPSILHYHHIIP